MILGKAANLQLAAWSGKWPLFLVVKTSTTSFVLFRTKQSGNKLMQQLQGVERISLRNHYWNPKFRMIRGNKLNCVFIFTQKKKKENSILLYPPLYYYYYYYYIDTIITINATKIRKGTKIRENFLRRRKDYDSNKVGKGKMLLSSRVARIIDVVVTQCMHRRWIETRWPATPTRPLAGHASRRRQILFEFRVHARH